MLEHRQRLRLGVEQEPVLSAQDAHVGADLSLGGQQRRVAALPGGERLDVVRDLALEEVRDVLAGQQELAARRVIDDDGSGVREVVLGGRDGHVRKISWVDENLDMP